MKRDLENIEEKLAKSQTALNKALVKGFACENDTRLDVERWMSKHNRYTLSDIQIKSENKKRSGKVGRPKKGEVVEKWFYASCKLSLNQEVIQKEQSLMGRFVLASNDTTIDPEVCLEFYKEQNTVERGFRFIKGEFLSRFGGLSVEFGSYCSIVYDNGSMLTCLFFHRVGNP